jgi:hypothetical protein
LSHNVPYFKNVNLSENVTVKINKLLNGINNEMKTLPSGQKPLAALQLFQLTQCNIIQSPENKETLSPGAGVFWKYF